MSNYFLQNTLVAEAAESPLFEIFRREKYLGKDSSWLINRNRLHTRKPKPFESEPGMLKFPTEIQRTLRSRFCLGQTISRSRLKVATETEVLAERGLPDGDFRRGGGGRCLFR